ncbi:MAG TPA: PQQ-binding-like beta-propeller repeat protein, partial [Xanthobacteraceae bacterium]|nr:PQQ-binding-like beta-propeller repeat protein [Xanthobacteraceae bacterium]
TSAGTFTATICALLATTFLAQAADVTPQRLLDPEPHNWLMNHRTYDGQRFSPLARITKDNVKNLKLAYAVPLGGGAGNEWLEATPLVEEGFLYLTDVWGVLYKIDGRAGNMGRVVWRMEPKQERPSTNRGAAFWNNLVISPANWPARVVATDKETGKIVWETNMMTDQPDLRITAAPLALKDQIIVGASGGDSGVRDWVAALNPADGKLIWRKYTIPAPGEPGSETWKGNTNAWQTGGGAVWVTGTYDPATNQTFWGTGNPVPMFDPFHRPGDNLYTNSAISYDPATGKMNWYFQYTPGDMWDYDEVGTHILIDGVVDGQQRKLVTHSARNGFLYTMDRGNGSMVVVKPYMDNVNWTKGIDPKTGRPVDYDPNKDIQTYAGVANLTPGQPLKKVCPSQAGGNNYFPSSYSQRSKLIYIPALTACVNIAIDREKHNKEKGWNGGLSTTDERWESSLTAVDPISGEVKKSIQLRYPNYSGTLATAGGVIFLALLDGTIAAYDETTLDELWKVNMGAGFTAPPMTFEVNGRQYVAIASGASPVARAKLVNTLELRDQRQATVLYVFGL